MKSGAKNIWLVCGGTGGHISPAISIFQELTHRNAHPLFLSLEKNKGYPSIVNLQKNYTNVVFYKASPIPKSFALLYRFIGEIIYSWKIMKHLFKKDKPDLVCAFGGYPVFPALLFAVIKKIPYCMHEQNSRAGFITRLFSRKATHVFLSFPRGAYKKNEILVGNPLRQNFLNWRPEKTKATKSKKTILFLGGSQGAKDINSLYLEMSRLEFFKNWKFIVSTGQKDFELMKTGARSADDIFPFIEDIPEKMKSSEYIISRSGSGVLYEILWSQTPAFFIPYPYAAANHQLFNAQTLSNVSSQYHTINLKPFNALEAAGIVMSIIESNQKKISTKNNPDRISFPLNAHQAIADILLN
ncbi:MAG: UDP-N-acetylglucosamine--N-acetylmuramyl-(pentapeptide) pyrophosphoryl-undecaprenol N-acetylglucosamine transferase [Spirochaetia bacterium]|nr:UDP-N-acetylglucosamine--N-acetylmuramyl-(pentapeptide) pyrophosphoryl-undecaprenol N-acetylglucosamine transferase [Spirochaetia bacterium]